MNKTDLSRCGQQHICVISGRHNKGYRPHADAAIEALGSLPSVAPFVFAHGRLLAGSKDWIFEEIMIRILSEQVEELKKYRKL